MLRGEVEGLQRVADSLSGTTDEGAQFYHCFFAGIVRFLRGDDLAAIEAFEAALALKRKMNGKRKVWFEADAGACYVLALLRCEGRSFWRRPTRIWTC